MHSFITGGRKSGEVNGEILNTVQIYDISSYEWTTSDNIYE